MTTPSVYPTALHQRAAEAIAAFFDVVPEVAAVLIVNSIARGVGTPESDLDIAVLVQPEVRATNMAMLEQHWKEHYRAQPTFHELCAAGRCSGVHLDVLDGQFAPDLWDDGGGPNSFELGVVRRFFCHNSACHRRTFSETLARPYCSICSSHHALARTNGGDCRCPWRRGWPRNAFHAGLPWKGGEADLEADLKVMARVLATYSPDVWRPPLIRLVLRRRISWRSRVGLLWPKHRSFQEPAPVSAVASTVCSA
jgi:predicted nucleotidyltransferase